MSRDSDRPPFPIALAAAGIGSVIAVVLLGLRTVVPGVTWLLFPALAVVMAAAGVRVAQRVVTDDTPYSTLGLGLVYWGVVFPFCFVTFVLALLVPVTAAFPRIGRVLTGYSLIGYLGLATITAVGCFVVALALSFAYRCGRSGPKNDVRADY